MAPVWLVVDGLLEQGKRLSRRLAMTAEKAKQAAELLSGGMSDA